ncbi:MAG: DUF6049 family protein [Streptosporangiaceae bacterium]
MSCRARIAAAALAAAAAAVLGLAVPAAASLAQTAQPRHSGASVPVSLAITSISPQYATPHHPITVTGQLTNSSATAISGMSVQLLASGSYFSGRDMLLGYADGQDLMPGTPAPAGSWQLAGSVPAHGTVQWSIRVPAQRLPLTAFGVYPLAAQAVSAAAGVVATSRSFLPYWPGAHSAYPRSKQMPLSWLWPLIDNPDQSVCPGLLTGGLAGSLAPGGRLAGLLAAAAADGSQAGLTWVVDPALLASAQTMTSKYRVSASASCEGGQVRPASKTAAAWLAALRSATAGQPVMVTPYADVDVAALTGDSLDLDLARAFRLGRSEASAVLHRSFSTGAASGSGDLAGYAWPADGIANYPVLGVLAVNGIRTVVLAARTMPPNPPQPSLTPSAVTSTPDGENGDMHVLLSDDTLTQILSSADSPGSRKPGTAFGIEQLFLAQTAMIAAEAPNTPRAVVVAPPRRWDPSSSLASGLLAETASAPWLRPVTLNHLAAASPAAGQVRRGPPALSSSQELSRSLLGGVRKLDRRVGLLQGMRQQPDPAVYEAVAGVESSAGRGRDGQQRAGQMLSQVFDAVNDQLADVTIIPALRVTLGGLRGTVPVSISNRLRYPVRVRLAVSVPAGDRFTITHQPGIITVPAGQISTVKLKVHAGAVGSTTVSLRLLTASGRPVPGDGHDESVTVQATQFGTVVLVIVAAALGVFMISSAARAIRRGQDAPAGGTAGRGSAPDDAVPPGGTAGAAKPPGQPGQPVQPGQSGQPREAGPASAVSRSASGLPGESGQHGVASYLAEADSVEASQVGQYRVGRGETDPDVLPQHAGTEETDDYAPAPGWSDRG